MLNALVEYAKREGVEAEAGFGGKYVRWVVVFGKTGNFRGVVERGDTEQRGNKGEWIEKAPHLKFSGDTPMRQFLVDTAQYMALVDQDSPGEDAGEEERGKWQKLLRKREYALNLMRDAAEAVPELSRIAEALADDATQAAIREALEQEGAKPQDNVTVAVDDRVFVREDSWHQWWRDYFPKLFEKGGRQRDVQEPMRCLISGQLATPARTHPKIKGLGDVGGKTEATFVSFNEDAFCSYDLSQSANAAVSENLTEMYAGALNQLIRDHSRRLAGAKVVHWYAGRVPEDADPLAALLDLEQVGVSAEDPEEADGNGPEREMEKYDAQREVRKFLDSFRTGERPGYLNYHYYAMTLSGSSARVVVRDWMEGRFEDLLEAMRGWFEDLKIVARDGQGPAPPPKLLAVLGSMVRDLGDLAPATVTKMWRVALKRELIPYQFMAQALGRVRMDIVNDRPINHARMGLLKAYCIRKGDQTMTSYLNPDHPDPAYHCGRLLAVIAYIQYKALGDVGAGVAQRYYAAASATPAMVLGRLIRTAQFHLNKIENPKEKKSLEMRLADIWGQLGDSVPSTLTLEQQTLFALGYYQQKAYRPSRDEQPGEKALSAEEVVE